MKSRSYEKMDTIFIVYLHKNLLFYETKYREIINVFTGEKQETLQLYK